MGWGKWRVADLPPPQGCAKLIHSGVQAVLLFRHAGGHEGASRPLKRVPVGVKLRFAGVAVDLGAAALRMAQSMRPKSKTGYQCETCSAADVSV